MQDYYEGTEKMTKMHYADRDVLLSLANYDYINYSIRLEQLKSAFRISYGDRSGRAGGLP